MRAGTIFRVILAATLLVLVLAALFVTQPMRPSRNPPPSAADPVRLRRDVLAISGIYPRNLDGPDKLDLAARYISERWQSEGLDVREQPYEVNGERVRNLSVLLGPEGGTRLVVGAHYDAAGRFPGADDNASGVAGLLELGRLLRLNPPDGAVELVAYALEEPPFFGGPQMGSAVHATSLRNESIHVRGMIALEMIGCFSDAPGSQSYPSAVLKLFYPDRGTFVAVVGRPNELGFLRRVKRAMADATDLPVRSMTGPGSLGGIGLSDNRSYWEAGHRAVMVTDTAYFRNTRYHTAQDTAQLLDYERMAKVVTGVFAAVRALAGT